MTSAARSGIPTTYRQARFRSRLEARWARFFDLVGWSWIYEPMDTGDWIPDFLVTGAASFLVEVGPCELLSEFSAKAAKPIAAFPPRPAVEGTSERITVVLGLGPLMPDGRFGYLTNDEWGQGTAPAVFALCRVCRSFGIYHESGSYQMQPCGHRGDGGHVTEVEPSELNDLWNAAGAAVQWRRR